MTITLNCPCGKVLACKDDDAGGVGKCPGCGKTLRIPGALAASDPADIDKKLQKFAVRVERWIFARQRLIWFFCGAGCVVVLAYALGAKYLGWPTPGARPHAGRTAPTERIVADGAAKRLPSLIRYDEIDEAPWASDFEAFAAAVHEAVAHDKQLQDEFTNKVVRWELTYRSVRDRTTVYFEEAAPLLEGNIGIYVWVTLLPNEAAKVAKFKPGDKFVIRGKIGFVNSLRTAAHPLGGIQLGPVDCLIE